jgi:hypothetical protein
MRTRARNSLGVPSSLRAWNCWSGPLARLGIARSHAINGNSAAARSAYQEFFTLWKNADSDIPILKEAKTEYAKLLQK